MNKLSIFGLLLAMAICTSCGGGGSNNSGGGGGGGGSIVVSVVPTVATVALNGTQQFSATVTPSGTAQTVTWAVAAGNGTTCSGATCGMVDANGLYTAPSTLPAGNPPFVIVTATSTADTTKSDNSTITLVSSQNNRVRGTYTFRFNGFNLAGPVLAVGNIMTDANGTGTILSGSMLISTSSGPLPQIVINGGTYSIGTPLNSNLGSMKLTSTAGDTFCYLLAVGSTTIDNPVLVQVNSTTTPYITCTGVGMGAGVHGSGLLNTAATSSFNLASVNQPYVFGLNGADAASKRASYAGRFVGDGTGGITSWSLDINDGGTATSINGSNGAYTVSGTGSGTVTLKDAAMNTVLTLGLYMKNQDEIFLTVTDPLVTNPRAVGAAESQDAAQVFDKTTFNGSSVFYTTGVGANPIQGNATVGRANTDGAGNVTGVVDQNDAGSITTNSTYNGTYNNTGNGRYTITLNGVTYVMYAITKNKGFLLDQSSSAVLAGLMEPQNGSNFSNSTINGTFVQTNHQVSTAGAEDIVAAVQLNGATGAISGTLSETNGTPSFDQNVAGTYTVNSSNGRGTYTLTMPSAATNVLYIVNGSRFVVLDTSNPNPSVLITGR